MFGSDEVFWFRWEERYELSLGFLVSSGFIYFLHVRLTCFYASRIVVYHDILYATHTHFDETATRWACHFSIDNSEVVVGSLKAGKGQECPSLLWTYHHINTTRNRSRFRQTFRSVQHRLGDENNVSSIV
jgi:hypothetical protein